MVNHDWPSVFKAIQTGKDYKSFDQLYFFEKLVVSDVWIWIWKDEWKQIN